MFSKCFAKTDVLLAALVGGSRRAKARLVRARDHGQPVDVEAPPVAAKAPVPLHSLRVRPRFSVWVEGEPETVRTRVLEALAQGREGIVVRAFPGLVGLHVADEQRRAWSPRLLLHFEPRSGGGTIIEGVYGPEIEVWSIFLYGYFFAGMIGSFSVILGGAQLFVGSTAWAFWITGAMALLAAGLYLAAQFGQKLGAWQTVHLHQTWQVVAATVGAGGVEGPASRAALTESR